MDHAPSLLESYTTSVSPHRPDPLIRRSIHPDPTYLKMEEHRGCQKRAMAKARQCAPARNNLPPFVSAVSITEHEIEIEERIRIESDKASNAADGERGPSGYRETRELRHTENRKVSLWTKTTTETCGNFAIGPGNYRTNGKIGSGFNFPVFGVRCGARHMALRLRSRSFWPVSLFHRSCRWTKNRCPKTQIGSETSHGCLVLAEDAETNPTSKMKTNAVRRIGRSKNGEKTKDAKESRVLHYDHPEPGDKFKLAHSTGGAQHQEIYPLKQTNADPDKSQSPDQVLAKSRRHRSLGRERKLPSPQELLLFRCVPQAPSNLPLTWINLSLSQYVLHDPFVEILAVLRSLAIYSVTLPSGSSGPRMGCGEEASRNIQQYGGRRNISLFRMGSETAPRHVPQIEHTLSRLQKQSRASGDMIPRTRVLHTSRAMAARRKGGRQKEWVDEVTSEGGGGVWARGRAASTKRRATGIRDADADAGETKTLQTMRSKAENTCSSGE
ncbi:hypothetical protein C8R45DRAFT_1073620 [Mycena sanguinolenta]|nr:hypothetical protein C8R45DRAFT_1073620 [Mycena sanguinolenta]